MTRRKLFSIIPALLACSALRARGFYSYEKSTTLSGASEAVTIQMPANSSDTAAMQTATIYSSVAATFTLERNGSLATTTQATPSEINGGSTGDGRAYYSSNVGSGTTIKTYTLSAGQELPIDLLGVGLKPGQNVTIRSASMTGSIRIYFQWRES